MSWFPSSREIVVTSGLKAPAWMFGKPAASTGANGSGLKHGEPFGPERILNSDDGSAGAFPDHGAIDAEVV